ncbi:MULTISPECIES: glycosyltransferase family 2 protein [Aequorivita]|uniref:Glycosyltransferase family 2 protein n=1 Tax=Aequorivita iocasae TaxID=2803865 RepID=A0ABX7DRK1_9FLAO|nr:MULTISPECIES: glycosyltransferase family A protein [Aequorivita]QQX76775.1 glycosyltransferase family 2 protein [Aequorivita iocasae]UCA56247.1 glycosyltransferase family 2 protein [Aequorivita sp. F7]
MLFTFLKYLQPTHYFQLYRRDGSSIFPIVELLPQEVITQLKAETKFSSKSARTYDLSWQAIQKGYIGDIETYTNFKKVPVIDEYRFLRKYFHKVWVLYVLLLRIGSFHNPIRELSAWKKSSDVKRSDYLKNPIAYQDWTQYQSSLLSQNPMVSVMIPTLNRYEYLKDVLEDLEKQYYKNFEVIIVDQSNPFQEEFYKGFHLDLRVVQQSERALWLARNRAIELSKGEYILLFDDDSRVEPDWITNHLKCLDFFNADISAGVSISAVGAQVPQNYSFFRISDQLDTGNVLLKKQIFRTIGLFDRQYEKQRMGDGEFGLRCYLNGYKNISNPYAERLHLKVGSGGLREMGSWDGYRPKKWFGARPVPSVLYQFRKYYGGKRAILALLKFVPPSVIPYQFKKSKLGMVMGFIFSIIIAPVIVFQIIKSWNLATDKLKEGALIKNLD